MAFYSISAGRLRWSVPVLMVLCLTSPTSLHAAKDNIYAIAGAKLVTISGGTIESGTLVLRDGVIEALGNAVNIPPDARVIDGKGLTLTPGLIDGFGGIGLPGARPASGGAPSDPPTSSSAPAAPSSALTPQALALEKVRPTEVTRSRDSGITTALVIPREGVLPGQSVLLNLAGNKAEAMAIKQPAALHVHMTTTSPRYPASLMGTMAYLRQALHDARRYHEEWTAYERSPLGKKRPQYDAALAAWQDVLERRQLLVVTASRENDIRRALALADEFQLKLALAGVPRASQAIDLVRARNVPLLVSVNFDPPRPTLFSDGDDQKERREIQDAEKNPGLLHQAGLRFALVSGYAPNFLAGVQKAVEKGLPREAALRALTLGPAEVLGVADRTGSLEVGKMANVVAWSGEPLSKEGKVKLVFVDGQLFEPATEQPRDSPRPDRPEAKTESEAKPAEIVADLPAPPVPIAGETIAIVGGTVLTVGPQATIEKGTVLIRDGKIAAVGRNVVVPKDARVVDAAGKFVMPGIIDCHSHTAIEGGVNEGSDSVTAEVRIADVLDHKSIDIYRQLAGGVTSANVLHGSANAIGGQNAVIKLRWGNGPAELVFKDAPRGIKFALGENPKRSNFRRPGPARYPATRMGVEVTIREAFREAQAYKREWENYERKLKAADGERPLSPRKNLRLETLKDVLEGKVLVHAHCYRSDEILMLIRLAEEIGFKIRTFQHVLEGYKVASEIARHGAGGSTFSDWWAYKLEAHDAIPYNAAIMASHGVRVSLNSDSTELARRLYWEAAKVMKYGNVSELDALKMITLNPAWQLGIDKWVGSLEVGKDADIAIFSAHPFAPETRCEMTLVDGFPYFDRARDLKSRDKPSPGKKEISSTGDAQ